MELQCLLGLKCNDFAMIAADQMNIESVFVMKDDHEKIHKITDRLMIGVMGSQADSSQLVQYVMKNMQLYRTKNSYPLEIGAVAHFARHNLAGARFGSLGQQRIPYSVNLLLAGYDEEEGGQLYFLDFLGSSIQVPYVGLGFGGMLAVSIMDRYYTQCLTEAEAYKILKRCTREIKQRLFIQLPKFQVSVVSKEGVKHLPPLVS